MTWILGPDDDRNSDTWQDDRWLADARQDDTGQADTSPVDGPESDGAGQGTTEQRGSGPEDRLDPAEQPADHTAGRSRRSRLRIVDLIDESLLGISAKPARLALTMIGTVVGIAALVATVGLGQTAAGQIAERFDAVAATRIVVSAKDSPQFAPDDFAAPGMPWDAADRVRRLSGVAAATTYSKVELDAERVSGVDLLDPTGSNLLDIPVVATTTGLLETEGGTVVDGRMFDAGHDLRSDPVVVLGTKAATRLNINRVDARPSIFIGETAFVVIGIIDGVDRRLDLLESVIIPNGAAAKYFDLAAPDQLDVRTEIGAAQQVGAQVAIAVAPNTPESISAQVPPKPGQLSTAVRGDVNSLFLAFGVVALIVGGLGIANVTLLSVMERTGEIGLRRAVGARRRHIAAQFLIESAVTGLLGGLIGAALGIVAVVAVSVIKDWTPILDIRYALVAPLLGAVIGLIAGGYPAIKAGTIEPIAALRRAG